MSNNELAKRIRSRAAARTEFAPSSKRIRTVLDAIARRAVGWLISRNTLRAALSMNRNTLDRVLHEIRRCKVIASAGIGGGNGTAETYYRLVPRREWSL